MRSPYPISAVKRADFVHIPGSPPSICTMHDAQTPTHTHAHTHTHTHPHTHTHTHTRSHIHALLSSTFFSFSFDPPPPQPPIPPCLFECLSVRCCLSVCLLILSLYSPSPSLDQHPGTLTLCENIAVIDGIDTALLFFVKWTFFGADRQKDSNTLGNRRNGKDKWAEGLEMSTVERWI